MKPALDRKWIALYWQCLAVSAIVLLTPLAGWSAPTGLRIIPTADVLATGQQRYEYEGDGSGKLYMPVTSTLLGVQADFGNHSEVGVDQVSSVGQVYNLKWQFLPESTLPAMAVGVQNITSGHKVQYYLVGSKTFAQLRLHAGMLRDEDGQAVTLLGTNLTYSIVTVSAEQAHGGRFDRFAYAIAFNYRSFSVIGTEYHLEGQSRTHTVAVAYTYGH